MADYKETTVEGKEYRRCYKVEIFNPHEQQSHLRMFEQDVVTLDNGKKIYQNNTSLYHAFDTNSELDIAIYTKLNELYVLLREARDKGE